MAARAEGLDRAMGAGASDLVRQSKVLVVGAGGIGCELLKTLVLTGFRDIEVVDLDTIDVSNLNRQFLFRKRHVGRPKCEVAREATLAFAPTASIVAHHGNIKSDAFNVDYFKKFSLVINALDNIGARRHVNRLCLAGDVALVEAGTAGLAGQTQPIVPGATQCYECEPKPTPTTYPVCTIRSTPEKPVHCVVWAKELYKLLFADPASSMMFEADHDASAFMGCVRPPFADRPDAADDAARRQWARGLFTAVFHAEIQSKIDMGRYKGAPRQPAPLDPALGADERGAAPPGFGLEDHTVPTDAAAAAAFVEVAAAVWRERAPLVGSLAFDKDHALDMAFVTAASHLRAACFGIPRETPFKIKEVAGNIVPAVATSNAVVAGLQVLAAVRLLQRRHSDLLATTLRPVQSRKGLFLLPTKLTGPEPGCFVCGATTLNVTVDTAAFTLRSFVQDLLKQELGFVEPSLTLGASILYEEGEDADDDMEALLGKPLSALPAGGIHNGSLLQVEDMAQGLECQVAVVHRDTEEGDDKKNPKGFLLSGKAPEVGPEGNGAAGGGEAAAGGEGVEELSDSDGLEVVDSEPAPSRKRENGGNGAAADSPADGQPAKRRRA